MSDAPLIWSLFKDVPMDDTYSNLARRNVRNSDIGYTSYRDG